MHVYSPKFFFFLEMVICGISSGAHFPMDKDSVCFDVDDADQAHHKWSWTGSTHVCV